MKSGMGIGWFTSRTMIESVYESGKCPALKKHLIKECAMDVRSAHTIIAIGWFAEGNSHHARPLFQEAKRLLQRMDIYAENLLWFLGLNKFGKEIGYAWNLWGPR